MAAVELHSIPTPFDSPPQVSVVLPCLNEVDAVAGCIAEAFEAFAEAGLDGEVVVVDNGSTDGSPEVATHAGARVVHESVPGYGSALRAGIASAKGDVVVMADADATYPLEKLPELVQPVLDGDADLVLGNRMSEADNATMPFLHRMVGTPALSFLVSRACGGSVVKDSQSGYRAFDRRAISALGLRSTGMEFASEMLIRASSAHLRIEERPTGYRARIGESKLNTVSDGMRHLRLILLLAPHLLLVWPGVAALALGAVLSVLSLVQPNGVRVGTLEWQPVFFSTIALVLGMQTTLAGMVIAHRSSMVGERVSKHYRFIGRPSFPAWCVRGGLLALLTGFAVDLLLFTGVGAGVTSPRYQPLAGLAQSLIIAGATLAAFGVFYRFVLSNDRPPRDPAAAETVDLRQ